MIVHLPLSYQPAIGAMVSVPVVGKVLAVRADPLAPHGQQIVVEIDTGPTAEFPIAGQPRKWDVPVQTGVGGGNT